MLPHNPILLAQIKQNNSENSFENPPRKSLVQGKMLVQQKQNKDHFVASNRWLRLVAGLIETKFSVIKRFQSEVTDLIYTQESLIQFIQAFIKCINKIGNGETKLEKDSIKELFSPSTTLEIKQEKKTFGGLLKDLTKSKKINYDNSFRIYHEIANIKKKAKEQKNIYNKFELRVQKTFEYNCLSDEQIDEVVKLQHVGVQIQRLGETIKFKLNLAKKQTESITLLLGNNFAKHVDSISNLQYDLSMKEVMLMAQIARQAWDNNEKGIYLLVIYFIKSYKCLQKHNYKVSQIQDKLNDSIDQILKKYRLQQKFSEKDLQYKELKKIQLKQQQFATQPQNLQSNQKQQQLQSFINYHAIIAKECKPLLENLVKSTCLDCLSIKLGLKYNIDSPNPKSMTRIIEKILFKDVTNEEGKQKITFQSSIDQQLKVEETDYTNRIQQKLKDKSSIDFTISDMVRGKCIFSSIEDIINTVKQIEKYIADNADSYRLIEVESRFANKTPISDVTLKIALKEKIVAELQLTLQTNAATYTFAHRIYEFFRTKVFSKIKVVDNYYKEFKQQFNQMVEQRVKLAEAQKANSHINEITQNIKTYAQQIRKYFDLKQDTGRKSFRQLLERELLLSQNQVGEGLLWADEQLQDLILPIFCMGIGEWGLQLGNKINSIILKQNHSDIFKSTLIYFFYRHIDVEQHFQSINQFQNKRKRQITQLQQINQQWKGQKILFQQYIEDTFGIKKVSEYHNNNARLFYQFKGLSAMIDCNLYEGNICHKYVLQINTIFGENSQQTFLYLLKFAKLCFLRKQYSPFQSLCKWLTYLISKLRAEGSTKQDQYTASIQLLMAENYLQQDNPKQAKELLDKNLALFRKKEDYKREIECEFMLVECNIKQDLIQHYQSSYRNVIQKIKLKEIPSIGRTVANTEWRIAQTCWKMAKLTKNQHMQKETLDNHYRRAIALFSAQNVEKCVIMAKIIPWGQFKKNNLKNPQMKENKLTVIFFLDLEKNIGTEGCEVLKEAKMSNLNQLFLEKNSIGSEGCQHLSSANWPNLSQLDLKDNSIGIQGCKYLKNASWPNLNQLDLGNNLIGSQGCQHLSRANWLNLSQLNLKDNSIRSEGCKYLVMANWPNLTQLSLKNNSIGIQGCQYLISAFWPNLSLLDLWNNSIRNQGCNYLRSSNWFKLTQLNLGYNSIGSKGYQYLRSANWPNLIQLNLKLNELYHKDRQALKKYFKSSSISLQI